MAEVQAPTAMATMPIDEQADVLDRVLSLATTFSTCVEAFARIHPSKPSDRAQKLALTKLGIEQGRLLIFGDVVGISSPPRAIATHMIPSRPGALNPDPGEPINFGIRDARLEQPETWHKVEATLNEILDRPAMLSRDELMEKYGLTSPKRPTPNEATLDTNRIEAFREKFGLLHDLNGQTMRTRRGMSITAQHWLITNVAKFEDFVLMVRQQVNTLIELFGIQDKIDLGMNIDIKALGWHPDIYGPIVRRDWEKLKRIVEACKDDYPQYMKSTELALEYLNRTWRETFRPTAPEPTISVTTVEPGSKKSPDTSSAEKKHRPAWLKSLLGKKNARSALHTPTLSSATTSSEDPQRSKSVDFSSSQSFSPLTPSRSKSLSHAPGHPSEPSDSAEIANPGAARAEETPDVVKADESKIEGKAEQNDGAEAERQDSPQETSSGQGVDELANELGESALARADTVNSMIDRRDRYPGLGRTETKEQRAIAHGWH